jgi:GGDEF domain-containing protein
VGRLGLQVPDRLPDEEKMALIKAILHEFESYRNGAENALRARLSGWRALVDDLLCELLGRLGIDAAAPDAAPLLARIACLTTAEDLQAYKGQLDIFLHPIGADGKPRDIASALKAADRSTANDNAAGLLGGGSAVEHLRKIMDSGGNGCIALFRLGCLEVINQRFGVEAVQDCVMAVSAYLTHSLHSDDAIYHWSDSSVLAILRNRYSSQILTAELQRIAAQNRDISINVDGRNIMVRIPLEFDLTPIESLSSADDLLKLSSQTAARW